jgi:quinol monooxygenase YgiN
MATILAHLKVRTGAEAQFEAIARDLFRDTHALEAGVLRYEYWRGSEPGTYYTLLSFPDFASFIVHQTSDHHETASPRLGSVLEGLRLEWLDPVPDASPLPATQPGGIAADADDLSRTYAQRFAVQMASWWGGIA